MFKCATNATQRGILQLLIWAFNLISNFCLYQINIKCPTNGTQWGILQVHTWATKPYCFLFWHPCWGAYMFVFIVNTNVWLQTFVNVKQMFKCATKPHLFYFGTIAGWPVTLFLSSTTMCDFNSSFMSNKFSSAQLMLHDKAFCRCSYEQLNLIFFIYGTITGCPINTHMWL